MVIRYKNTYGDGTINYVDVDIPEETEPTDEEITDSEALTRYANELTGASDQTLIEAAETLITEKIKED